MPIPRLFKCTRGQSLVEFSLILPILMILVFGILDFGLGLRSYISLSNAVREGARYASVGNPVGIESDCNGMTNDTVYGRICVATGGLNPTELDPDVSFPQGVAPGNSVVVSAVYTYNFVTPIGDLIGFFSGGAFPNSVDLSSSANMRLE